MFVVCSYCGKDFESIGRHRWRCKKRLDNSTGPNGCINTTQERDSGVKAVCEIIKCSCGKECKGVKGLKMHQRRCRVNENMDFDQPPDFENSNIGSCDVANDNQEVAIENQEVAIESLQTLKVKPGVKLPRSNDNWSEANNFFKSILSTLEVTADSVNEAIQFMNNTIYDFFKDNYGIIESVNQANGLFHKYNHITIKQLKRELAQLKRQNTPLTEVRYVSRLLRSKLGNSPGTAKSNDSVRNYDGILHKNFWGFVKNILQKSKSILPSFTQDHCTKSFLDFFRAVFPQRTFNTSSWLPSLPEPSTPFDQSPPSYEKITTIVCRMKSSNSPCSLDKINPCYSCSTWCSPR